ncbi:MAG: anaerobic ribonucleoside-triphosphate reductase activating protein [Chromatiales bacterium 21-64-14]|nr:MAG: anaerobic ribonucleoside-triphosphate reductase activating protein [Chromatiales bacterium 21-64-14]
MRLGGLVPLTTIDFPGRLAAVVFCQGCPWRCGYCHNPHLLPASSGPGIGWERVRDFLERRRGLLDAVVFSGGEPTAQPALEATLAQVKALGFEVGLHTAGIYPQRLARLLDRSSPEGPLVDWIGLDAKGPLDRYEAITGVRGAGARFRRSLDLVLESGIAYEVRTTLYDEAMPEELLGFARWLADRGVRHYVWQARRGVGLLNERQAGPGGGDAWRQAGEQAASLFERFEVRGASPEGGPAKAAAGKGDPIRLDPSST